MRGHYRTRERTEILECFRLKCKDFDNQEKAFEAADSLVQSQREEIKGIPERHPDKITPVKQLDQFWFINHKGRGL